MSGRTLHVNDADTGLVYMQQRYYDPVAGRFLSVDPVTTDAKTGGHFNRYQYGENNPYKFKDPDGRQSLPALEHPIVPVLRDIAAGGASYLPAAPAVSTGTISTTTVTVGLVEVSRTSNVNGSGSTFVGLRATPGLAVQTTAQGQAKVGETGGLTVKVSASAGLGAAGLTGSVSASVGSSGPGLQVSGGGVGAANAGGGILGVRPPTVAVGVTIKDEKLTK